MRRVGESTRRLYHTLSKIRRTLRYRGLSRKWFSGNPRYNVIMVTIECLRYDHLKCMRFLSSVNSIGALFPRAYAASSWTAPSVSSILTGLYPSQHGARLYLKERNLENIPVVKLLSSIRVKAGIPSIPELLASLSDYYTYFSSGGILFTEVSVSELFNNIDVDEEYDVGSQIAKTIKLIEHTHKHLKKKFIIHIHIGDTHDPLRIKQEDYLDDDFKDVVSLSSLRYINPLRDDYRVFRNRRLKLYCEILSRIDRELRELYRYLVESNLDSETVMMITSDHGEELWDHYELEREFFYDPRGVYGLGHGHNMFEEIIRVPTAIIGPDIHRGVFSYPISLIDLYVTLLDILGVKYSDEIIEGFNTFNSDNLLERHILVEDSIYGYDKMAIVFNKYKYIVSPYDNVYWEFNLHKDPREKNPNMVDIGYIMKELNIRKDAIFKSKVKPILANTNTVLSWIMRFS